MNAPQTLAPQPGPPLWLLAELTYRCPLHCVYCYNPVDFAKHEDELTTEEWFKVLREARALGSVQCGFSGGEPMLRDDLELLVAEDRPSQSGQAGYQTASNQQHEQADAFLRDRVQGLPLNEAQEQALIERGWTH